VRFFLSLPIKPALKISTAVITIDQEVSLSLPLYAYSDTHVETTAQIRVASKMVVWQNHVHFHQTWFHTFDAVSYLGVLLHANR
jgi:hypothetical protein